MIITSNTNKVWIKTIKIRACYSRYGSQLVRVENSAENSFVGRLAKNHLKALGFSSYWIGKPQLNLYYLFIFIEN